MLVTKRFAQHEEFETQKTQKDGKREEGTYSTRF